jgi:hypothetical protein
MKKIKVNASQRAALRRMPVELEHQYDWERRLQNALLALSLSDPRWMMFVEREINTEMMSLQEIVRLIEARARDRVLKGFRFALSKNMGQYIFRDNWLFTERGTLSPG